MSTSIKELENDQLVEVYSNAKKLNLDMEFIKILEEEITRRNILPNEATQT
ncbi:sporulation histidine kinase inhibitor Sda [Salipaludibacillus keqinensis]|uniref:Sporulation histidine kinase inhibitor Sda n=1 Tax=Salipaludibacillus keqinensis TaxID=2045207 RepID=A0A323TZM9_9BACI|nr:sporulation histidine kinase inhibitor Sda [Salipaludibacillus keqinensis]PYZ95055.1 sporulation histidine kinase inhibitor Sda [Salipaludibacillus keqinensis]